MDSSGSSLFGQIFIIIILTLINAVFAAAEIAFVSVNQSKIKQLAQEGDKRAARVQKLIKNSDDFLATIQVAITFAGFFSSASAATTFGVQLAEIMPNFPGAETIATVIVTLIIIYISLVFGELFPKQIALQMPETIALSTSGIIMTIQTIARPFIWSLSASTGLLQKLTPIDFSEKEENFTRDEMKAIFAEIRQTGSMDMDEITMMEGVLSLDTQIARDVMVPRTDTQMLDINDSQADNLKEIIESPFSRIPLYRDDKDNVVGIVHVKNLFKMASQVGFDQVDLLEVANEPMFVPATIYIDDLLVQFKHEQTHMAILIDEYGGVEGVVTMEDLLEEIVGEIDDESDIASVGDIRPMKNGQYYLSGSLTIDQFNHYFDQQVIAEEVDTIAGLIIQTLGYVPRDQDQLTLRLNDFVLKTDHIENGRIYGIILDVDKEHEYEVDYIIG